VRPLFRYRHLKQALKSRCSRSQEFNHIGDNDSVHGHRFSATMMVAILDRSANPHFLFSGKLVLVLRHGIIRVPLFYFPAQTSTISHLIFMDVVKRIRKRQSASFTSTSEGIVRPSEWPDHYLQIVIVLRLCGLHLMEYYDL
jgi:hypothetical protein